MVKKPKTLEEEREQLRRFEERLNRKPSKRDLGLGFGLGIGAGILTAVGLHAESMPINIWDRTASDYIVGGLIVVSFFCFCIIMGLLLQKES